MLDVMIRLEVQVLVCMCRFAVDGGFDGIVCFSMDEDIKERELMVSFFLEGELNVRINVIYMLMKF